MKMITYPIYSAGLTILFGSIIRGNILSAKECLTRALYYLPLFFVAETIVLLFTFLGFILLVVPGIIIGIKLSLYQFYLILSGDMPINAVKHSYNATDGFTKIIFFTTFKAAIPMLVLSFALIIFLSFLRLHNPIVSILTELFMGCYAVLFHIILFRFFCEINQNKALPNNGMKIDGR